MFNGPPYLSYGIEPPSIVHASLSRATPHSTVAVFRETALPCVSRRQASFYPVAGSPATASGDDSSEGMGSISGSGHARGSAAIFDRRTRTSQGSAALASSSTVSEMIEKEMMEILAAAGMAQTVHRRGIAGEARSVTMVRTKKACSDIASSDLDDGHK